MSGAEVVPTDGDIILQSPWPWLSRPCSCLQGINDFATISDPEYRVLEKNGEEKESVFGVRNLLGDEQVLGEEEEEVCPVHGRKPKATAPETVDTSGIDTDPDPTLPCRGFSFLCEHGVGCGENCCDEGNTNVELKNRERSHSSSFPVPPRLFDSVIILM